MDPDLTIRRVQPQDAAQVWALRLEMLADYPLAYLQTLDQAASKSFRLYQQRALANSKGSEVAQFLAFAGEVLVGQVIAVAHDPAATTSTLAAVYISPQFRGRGLLCALVEAAADWSTAVGRPELVLEVVDGNDRALRAYAKLGFVVSEVGLPHPTIPGLTETRMRRGARDLRGLPDERSV